MESAEEYLAAAEKSLHQGRARAALDEARGALRTQPESGRAFALIGLAHTMMGEEQDAHRAMQRAQEHAPLDSRVRYLCYIALGRLGDTEGARGQLTYFTQLEPKNAEAKAALARLGGAVVDLAPLPRPASAAVWYDGTGHALTDSGDFDEDNTDAAEPPPGADVVVCPACQKRTFKGWVCGHCGANLPRV